MQVKVLFFGLLRDIAGRAEDRLELGDGATLDDVYQHYATLWPRLVALRRNILLAQNQRFAPGSSPLRDGDEVAFLPPVSGGTARFTHEIADPEAGHFFALTRDAIDTRALVQRLLRPEDGAVVDFQGVVRNNTNGRPTLYLDYECYEAMAIQVMADIGRQIAAEHPIGRIGMIHRLGRMHIGEASVAVVVTAPHRKPAFAAALEGINRLKRMVPIWKKEYFAGGEVWVEGEWDETLLKD